MKRNVLKIVFSSIFIVSPFCVGDVFACQCFGLPIISQAYKNSAVVFTGKVADLEVKDGRRIFTFQVNENFKGNLNKELKVENGLIGDMCDYGFTVGESYLVYAGYGEDKKNLFTENFCSRNDSLADAQGQIFFLRELLKGKPESQIYGSVIRRDLNQITYESVGTPLRNIKILVEGEGKRFETVTDENGIFRLNKIPKGRYKVKPEFPADYANSSYPEEEQLLVLESGKVISAGYSDIFSRPNYSENESELVSINRGKVSDGIYAGFSLRWNNRVDVKIVDAEGKAVGDAKVRLLPVAVPFKEIERNSYRENRDREYGFAGLTPARYYLVVEIDAPFPNKFRFFYPQTRTPEKATVISIKAIDNLQFNFVAPVVQRRIEGKIFWSDGTPIVGDVRIVLSDSENPEIDELRANNYDVTSLDGASFFSLDGYAGAEYWIHTFVFVDSDVDGQKKSTKIETKPIKIKVEKNNEPLKILIPKPDKRAN